jgi:hypothetical protein
MIGPLLLVPAEDDRDDAHRSTYVSKKDVKWVLIGIAVLAVILYPVYINLKRQSDSHVCAANMNLIYQAISLYANDHDDRFPPVVQTGAGSPGAPTVLQESVYSWVSLTHRYNPKVSFVCPAAQEDENSPNQVTDDITKQRKIVQSSYGMYKPYGGMSSTGVERSGETVLFAETSNFGSQSSFDPVKFFGPDKQPIPYDGFSIAWNDSNVDPGAKTTSVTRLAFRKSASGNFGEAFARHDVGVHAISVDGGLINLAPNDAHVQTLGGQIKGRWSVPALSP